MVLGTPALRGCRPLILKQGPWIEWKITFDWKNLDLDGDMHENEERRWQNVGIYFHGPNFQRYSLWYNFILLRNSYTYNNNKKTCKYIKFTIPSMSYHILKSLHDNLIINTRSYISFNVHNQAIIHPLNVEQIMEQNLILLT